jgi:hypothetical protein
MAATGVEAGAADLGRTANDVRGGLFDHSAMKTTNARSRFLLLPQVDEASTMVKAPAVLRRYSLARLAASAPARPEQRPYQPQPQP